MSGLLADLLSELLPASLLFGQKNVHGNCAVTRFATPFSEGDADGEAHGLRALRPVAPHPNQVGTPRVPDGRRGQCVRPRGDHRP